jgi:cytochrome c oxidase assembly protein subunit 15
VTPTAALPPAAVRRTAFAALAVAFVHIVFGAIVRISGSGMGCGDNWPKCYGYWFPPLARPDLIIEVSHRYLAAALFVSIAALFATAWRHRAAPGVAGRGGVLRAAGTAVALWFAPAIFGGITVFVGNAPWATVVHKLLAASLLAVLATVVMRAGGLGAARAVSQAGSARAVRGAGLAAGLALTAVLLGGLTAKLPNAAIACKGFPLCGAGSLGGGAQHVQLTHRVIAYLLAFHILGLVIGFARRREAGAVLAAVRVAMGVVVLQIALGAAMVLLVFPPVLRSAHQATGIALWLTTFVTAYLARIAAGATTPAFALPHRPTPDLTTPTDQLPLLAMERGR